MTSDGQTTEYRLNGRKKIRRPRSLFQTMVDRDIKFIQLFATTIMKNQRDFNYVVVVLSYVILSTIVPISSAWISTTDSLVLSLKRAPQLQLVPFLRHDNVWENQETQPNTSLSRRSVLHKVITTSTVVATANGWGVGSANAIRAVGSKEAECQKNSNCLEVGELDGALGWTWGGKDRCDVTDPQCGVQGKLREEAIRGQPVPALPNDIEGRPVRFTHVAAIEIEIGRGEIGVLRLGLYGNEAPESVAQLVSFLSPQGLVTLTPTFTASTAGTIRSPVSLGTGGIVTNIVPNMLIELGIPSQANAYARSRGSSKIKGDFQPQSPPPPVSSSEGFVRPHDSAGLLSVPSKGLGYGGFGFENDDECFESAIMITDSAIPDFDKRRRVVGQIIDGTSMAFLERLANLPTQRGLRGVIPGQTSGPPLPKVIARRVAVSTVDGKSK